LVLFVHSTRLFNDFKLSANIRIKFDPCLIENPKLFLSYQSRSQNARTAPDCQVKLQL
jgi:hypothetical protein